jgi:transposase InsO family protein/transposase-like protein
MSDLDRKSKDFTEEERRTFLSQFESSGLRFDEFAREHNINPNTFKNWIWLAKNPDFKVNRYTPVERKKIVESFLSSDMTMDQFSKTWGVSGASVADWVRRYQEHGSDGLMNKKRNSHDKRLGSKIPQAIHDEIVEFKKKQPNSGIKKISQWLYRFRGVRVSKGTVRKTVVANGLPLAMRKKKRRKSSDKVRRFERARPMQLWQSDITQKNIGIHSQRVYLTVFMDDHSRYIVGWRLQSRQTAELVLDAFKDAVGRFGKPEEVLTDQGRQYFAWRGKSELEKLLEKENIKHVVSRAHHPQTLGKCERFWETLNNEYWTRTKPQDLEEARTRLKYFIDHYNHQRPHQGLDGQCPADRFFGIAEEVREAIEKSVEQNSLKMALGELPKPPAFLIGQVGDQRIAFHGTSGGFYLTHENLKGEKENGEFNQSRNIASTFDTSSEFTKVLQKANDEGQTTESITSNPDQICLGASDRGRSWTGPENIDDHNGILVGPIDEDGSSRAISNETNSSVAIEPASDFGNEYGIINTATQTKGGSHEN